MTRRQEETYAREQVVYRCFEAVFVTHLKSPRAMSSRWSGEFDVRSTVSTFSLAEVLWLLQDMMSVVLPFTSPTPGEATYRAREQQ